MARDWGNEENSADALAHLADIIDDAGGRTIEYYRGTVSEDIYF